MPDESPVDGEVALLLNDKLPVGLLELNGGSFGDPAAFSLMWFGTGRILGIPVSVYVFLGVVIAGWLVLNRTRYGRYVVAVGGNREAARIAGPPTPLSRPPGVSSGPNGSQILAWRSRQPAISSRRSATFLL